MNTKVRDNKVDAIKGFAILCVVTGHRYDEMESSYDDGYAFPWKGRGYLCICV